MLQDFFNKKAAEINPRTKKAFKCENFKEYENNVSNGI